MITPHESAGDASGPRFPLGQVVATANAARVLPREEILAALNRHMCADWGDVGKDDWRANDQDLVAGGRLLSVYRTTAGTKFWIITEADRSVTTVLLPEDY
ncbi:MAG: hypothetical protein EOP84_35125 [Verrucomicrobiaceae bacterium]|nr:MAG: hypothetical protein EOP84_35125 [Verrucomicrobiaceae bacterium]